MRCMIGVATVLSLLMLASPVVAQDGPATVSRSFTVTVRVGHDQQFEEAWKQHIDWHRQQNDSWTWNTWMIVSGTPLGQPAHP